MPRYHIRRKSSDEVFAEYALQAIVIVATLGLVVVGSAVVGVFREIARVYAEHGQKGQPKARQLKRAWQSLLAAWVVACLLLFSRYALFGLLLAGVSPFVFVMYILVMGKVLGLTGALPEGADELDSYLEPFPDSALDAPEPVMTAGSTKLRVIHTTRSDNSASSSTSGR